MVRPKWLEQSKQPERELKGRLRLAFEDLAWMDTDYEFLSKFNIMILKRLKLKNDMTQFSLLKDHSNSFVEKAEIRTELEMKLLTSML